jgi:hypothetical protein
VITLTREEAQQVLDALWGAVSTCFDQYSHEQVMSNPKHFINQTIETLRARLAQPEPSVEPYGYVTTHTVTGQQFFCRYPESPYLDNAKEYILVYAHPPQRKEWQGLTDKEVFEMFERERLYTSDIKFARAIEAKLREKNDG